MKIEELIETSTDTIINTWLENFQRFVNENRAAQDDDDEHLYFDAIMTFVRRNHEMPNAFELRNEMFDEWDDIASVNQCSEFLNRLEKTAK